MGIAGDAKDFEAVALNSEFRRWERRVGFAHGCHFRFRTARVRTEGLRKCKAAGPPEVDLLELVS
jgi:hypothetical protein